MMKRLLVLVLVISTLLSLNPILQPAIAQEESDVKVFIVGPDSLGISDKAVYTITVVGGPGEEEGGKWRVSAHLTGKNITDASPTLGDMFNETQETNMFRVNVTAPSISQGLVLNVQGASLLGNESALVDDTYSIAVVDPINLRATVTNPSNSTLKNVLVNFKVDGDLVGSSTIEEIGPFSEGTATFSWITKKVSPGRHELHIEIDLDGDGTIDETRGEALFIENLYGPPEGPDLLVTVLIVLLVIVILILLPSTIRRKRRK